MSYWALNALILLQLRSNGVNFFETISEQYGKYLIKCSFDFKSYYIVWGIDLNDDSTDKLLIDRNQNIVLFNSISDIKAYCNNTICEFKDRDNLIKWVGNITKESKAYTVIKFEYLLIVDFKVDSDISELYALLGIIQDYANQVQNLKLIELLSSKQVDLFMDVCSNFFIWKSTERKAFEVINLGQLKAALSEINKELKCWLRVFSFTQQQSHQRRCMSGIRRYT